MVVEVVVLDLEVLAEGEEDLERGLERFGRGDAAEVECERDGEVEGVVGRLVLDDERVPGKYLVVVVGGTRFTHFFKENRLRST